MVKKIKELSQILQSEIAPKIGLLTGLGGQILTRIIHREANLQFQSRHGVLVGYIFKNSV